MIKLSDLPDDTLLLSGDDDHCETANDLKDDKELWKGHNIYIAEKHPASLTMNDLNQFVETIAEDCEQYEDWDDDIKEEIKESPTVQDFLSYMNSLFKKYITYEMGEWVEDDRKEDDE